MNTEQLAEELNSLLSLLSEQQAEIDTIQEKFQVALTGILRLVGEGAPTLTNLHGNTENLQLNANVAETTTKSYQSLRKRIEAVIELVSSSDRKS